jgi:rhamnose transport system substrate-binding protein
MLFHPSGKRKNLARALSMTAAAVALVVVATGCSSGGTTGSTSGSNGGSHNYKITFLPKNLGNAYFDTSDKGGEKAIKEFKGSYAEVGPATATADAQVSYINTLTQQNVGAIVLSANDPTALGSALTQARSAGFHSAKAVTVPSVT